MSPYPISGTYYESRTQSRPRTKPIVGEVTKFVLCHHCHHTHHCHYCHPIKSEQQLEILLIYRPQQVARGFGLVKCWSCEKTAIRVSFYYGYSQLTLHTEYITLMDIGHQLPPTHTTQ